MLPSETAGRQFGLRGLLSFMLACSLYLALIVVLRDLYLWGNSWTRYPFPYGAAVLIPMVWFAFWWLYRKWGLRHAIIVHVSGPIIFLGLVLLFGGIAILVTIACAFVDDRPPRPDIADVFDVGGVLLLSLYYGSTVSTLVSFPASIAMLLHLATKTRRTRISPSPN
jgi:hypothetical protein